MDQTLKARLIGAAVLIVIAVLVIPELLSGRKSEPASPTPATGTTATRTYTIELGAPSAGDRPVDDPEASRRRESAQKAPMSPEQSTSRPAASPGPSDLEAPVPAPSAAEAKPAPPKTVAVPASKPVDSAPRSVPSTPGAWSVQVGAFGSAASARKLETELASAGYDAFVSQTSRNGKTLHRVRVGGESSKAAAESLAARLKARGLPATVVAND